MSTRRNGRELPRWVLFKQLKDAKDMVNAAPGMVAQAQRIPATQAQQMAAAQQAAMQAQMAHAGGAQQRNPVGPDFDRSPA